MNFHDCPLSVEEEAAKAVHFQNRLQFFYKDRPHKFETEELIAWIPDPVVLGESSQCDHQTRRKAKDSVHAENFWAQPFKSAH